MLRSTRKEVKETIKNYIIDNFCDYYEENKEYLQETNINNYKEVCSTILSIFNDEMLKHNNMYKAGRTSKQALFYDWCAGLCSAIDTSYFYSVCAVDLLGDWLQETETEKEKYTEEQAEKTITYLIYRELTNNAN